MEIRFYHVQKKLITGKEKGAWAPSLEFANNKKGRQGLPIVVNSQNPLHHQIPVEAAVLYRFADVFGSDFRTPSHVSYGAPDFQYSVIRPRGETKFRDSHFQDDRHVIKLG